ncbi:hypothetical protein [Streptomyces sp. A1136]|uniref:hypothetical protein n=1 Tax=Streptomyces sp. A1136 TaxID=2563102 RepID=UPI00109E9C92|nr:hypothetical protein [Streptomyces sp. A1136]THA43483.1 hypothetical protein E6R62_37540 [Streptomyces sp. A1136]
MPAASARRPRSYDPVKTRAAVLAQAAHVAEAVREVQHRPEDGRRDRVPREEDLGPHRRPPPRRSADRRRAPGG